VRDVSEWLVELGPVAARHPLDISVAYHDACHLAHAQGIRTAPRDLLSAVPGVELREIAEAAICCGSAGVYNILEPDAAAQLGARKAANVAATDADVLVTANPGCLMQIRAALDDRGTPMPVAHTVQLLDASIRGVPLS
jgi:glycolate oxidase iron-sulfur subunit